MGAGLPHEDAIAIELPPVEEADEQVGVEGDDENEALVSETDEDPFDDACADDLPLDYTLSTTAEEGSAVGDDRVGIEEGGPEDALAFQDGSESLLDDGRPDEAMGVESDDDLGLDRLPGDLDDGGLEGLDDAAGERVDELAFPPLDGAEDDNEDEIDLGIDISQGTDTD
jgi:hypothetical protein